MVINGPLRDVFLSHTSSDKVGLIYPLVQALEKREISYWLDEGEISWGQSLLARISEGLEISRFVLVFITENFLGRKWPPPRKKQASLRKIFTS